MSKKKNAQIARLKKEAAKLRTKQRYRQAAAAYRDFTELDPANPTWPHKLGHVLQHMGRADEAMDAMEQAAENYLNKGFVLKAIAMCKMILMMNPDNTRIQETLLLLHERNPRPRRTGKLQVPDTQVDPPVELPPPSARAAAAMAPMHEVELDLDQLDEEADAEELQLETNPVIMPVDTGQILSVADDGPLELLPAAEALPSQIALLETAPNEAAPKEAAPDEDAPARPGRRRPDTLENLPLTVALPDVRPTSHATGQVPVYHIPLEEEWVDIDMDEFDDEETDPASRELLQRLPQIPLLSSLSTDELRSFINKVSVEQFQPGDAIIEQGDWGETLYILVQGTVGVLRQEPERVVTVGMHSEGAFFGEYALLTRLRHSATVEAMDECTVLSLSRKVVRELVEEHPPVLKVLLSFFRQRLIQNLTTNHPLFKPFSTSERQSLVKQFHFLEAPPNRVLVREGQRPDGLYLLVCGQATVHREGAPSSDLRMGEMFCKTALLSRTVSSNTVRTASKCWLLWMPRELFGEVIMTHPHVLATLVEAKTTGRLTAEELGFDDHEETLAVV